MRKFTVEDIKYRAESSLKTLKGYPGKDYPLTSLRNENLRAECRKVLFLCREIEKLRKQVKQNG